MTAHRPLGSMRLQQRLPGAGRGRIVILVNSAWNAVTFRRGLIRAMLAAGHEVIVIAPPDATSGHLTGMGCRFTALSMDNSGTSPIRDLMCLLRLWHLLRAQRPDLLLGFTVKPNIYGSLAAGPLNIPVINNISGLGTAFIGNGWMRALVSRLYRLALGRSRVVFLQNPDDRNLFIAGSVVRPSLAALLPGSGVDTEWFRPVRARAGDGRFRFLLIARLIRDKGIGEFVEAAKMVRRRRPDTVFQLLGYLGADNRTAIDRNTVDAWVAEGTVEYLGASEDVRPFIAKADCIVLPSYREGTPKSLLEGGAMGKPLIATDVPGCRTVVDDGVNGFLCKVRDAQDLAHRMLTLLSLEPAQRSAMGQASRDKIARDFAEGFVIARYLDSIDGCLGRRGHAFRPASAGMKRTPAMRREAERDAQHAR